MTDDKSLPGGQEKIVRAIERLLVAQQRPAQEGVRVTNLASGKLQVEVHAYDGDLTVAGNRARAEFDRQMAYSSVPTEELEHLRWLASIGQAAIEHGWKPNGNVPDNELHIVDPPEVERSVAYEEQYDAKAAEQGASPYHVHDIEAQPAHRRKTVYAEPEPAEEDPNADLIAQMQAAVASPAPGPEVSDA